MAMKGKRRASQRGKGAKKTATNTGTPSDNGQSSPITPPLTKRRRVAISSPGKTRPSDSPLGNKNGGGSPKNKVFPPGLSRKPNQSNTERPPSRVHTPPPSSRRMQKTRKTYGGNVQEKNVERREGEEQRFRTAETIPDESGSDDRDVYVLQREPLERNEFYKRYVSYDLDDANSDRNVAQRLSSPVSPDNLANRDGGLREVENDEFQPRFRCASGEGMYNVQDDDVGNGSEFQVTRGLLSSFHDALKDTFVSEIKNLRDFVSDKFRVLELLERNLTQQMNEIRVVASSGRSMTNSQGRPTPLAKYEAKLDLATPHGEWVFNVETMCKVLRVNLCMFVLGVASETGSPLGSISLALRAILFGLLPSQKRAAFTNGVGREHSNFRFTVVLNILYNVQQNVFNRFLVSDLSADSENAQVLNLGDDEVDGARLFPLDNTVMQIKQPKWMRSGFIRKRHVEDARARLETNVGLDGNGNQSVATEKQRRVWLTVKESPDGGDIARYGALKVYRCVSTGLYQAREKVRWVLFEELTYIMTIWDSEAADIDQCSLKLQWGEEQDICNTLLSTVPLCINRKSGVSNADEQNHFALAQFLSARQDMVLYITHDVKMRVTGKHAGQRRSFEVRKLRRAVNLVDVACKFCVVFTEQTVGEFSYLPFLGAHKESLKCIYAVALMLRAMVDAFMDEYMVGGAFVLPQDLEDAPHVECHGMSLDYLLPAASVRKRLLLSKCLRMGVEEFNKLNVCVDGHPENTADMSPDIEEEHIDIHHDGVMRL